jgi:putative transposase
MIILPDGHQNRVHNVLPIITGHTQLPAAIKKIKTLQRKLLSKKKKGSHNKLKAKRMQLAKLWRKVRLQREDYCHKVTTNLTKRYRIMIFEKLSISNMVKNHNLATQYWIQLGTR